jgi:hypothetical protein
MALKILLGVINLITYITSSVTETGFLYMMPRTLLYARFYKVFFILVGFLIKIRIFTKILIKLLFLFFVSFSSPIIVKSCKTSVKVNISSLFIIAVNYLRPYFLRFKGVSSANPYFPL